MTSVLEDPLRAARHAVEGGRFRDGWGLLDDQPPALRRTAEWQLLAAMARWRLGEFGPSHAAALQARDAYRAAGDTDGEMRAENVAAAGAFARGRLPEAERGFARALELAERAGDRLLMARAANNLGNVAFYRGRHDTALACYRLARARFARAGLPHGEAEALINVGLAWRELDRPAEAQEAGDQALEIAERIQSRRLIAQALAMRGEAIAQAGDAAVGRTLVERALALARVEDDRLAEIEALRLRSNMEREAGDLAAAQQFGEEALALARRIHNPWTVATVLKDLGHLHLRRGDGPTAARAFSQAAESYAEIGADVRARRMREEARQASGAVS